MPKPLPKGLYSDQDGKIYKLDDFTVEVNGRTYSVMFSDESSFDNGPRIAYVPRGLGNTKVQVARNLSPASVDDEVRPVSPKSLETKTE